MSLYEFKNSSFARGFRIQNVEDNFKAGMQFTDTALPLGYIKTLVNYDIYNNGAALKPRPGLRMSMAAKPWLTTDCVGTETIVAAREQQNGTKVCAQFFVKHSADLNPLVIIDPATGVEVVRDSETPTSGPLYRRVYRGDISMLTTTGIPDTVNPASAVPMQSYHTVNYANTNYIVPAQGDIHGVLIGAAVPVRHVGCYAWNKNYYFFDPVAKKIVYSEYDVTTGCYVFKTDVAKILTPKEAALWGYNMLSEAPYTFVNESGPAVIVFTGMLPYDADGALALTPVINQSLTFKTFYRLNKGPKYDILWEWRSIDGDVWTTLQRITVETATTLPELSCPFSPPSESVVMRVSAYGYTGETVNTYADQVLAVGFSFNKTDYGSTANILPTTYNLYDAAGMTYWRGRLIVWGLEEDNTLLFASDVNNPTYFPYPNSCDKFDEPIKYAIPFLDKLLVFTSTKLYMLTLSADGLAWSTNCIQNNLLINDWDVHLIQIVKNMVYFKSGNYFYMIVPKSSSVTGELTIAAISTPMKYFFDSFMESVSQIVDTIYQYTGTLTLQHYYNYLDFEDVHNVYTFKTDYDEYLNFSLLYNVVTRSWRCYIIGSQNQMVPYKSDATQRGTLCALATMQLEDNSHVAIPQLLRYSANSNEDYYLTQDLATGGSIGTEPVVNYISESTVTLDGVVYSTGFFADHRFKNWQFLDTGYREHQSNFKKRYRELQFIVNNVSNTVLKYYTDFVIDGEPRKSRYETQVVQELDEQSPNYGRITVERVLTNTPEILAPGVTMLGASTEDVDAWQLDVSTFPGVAYWKARFPVSGKGYTPRFQLLCFTERDYELLNISWVYRELYSR